MGAGDFHSDGKPKARSGRGARRVAPIESVEDPGEMSRGDADPSVADRHGDLAGGENGRRYENPAGLGELDGVVEQVGEEPDQVVAVSRDGQSRRNVLGQR